MSFEEDCLPFGSGNNDPVSLPGSALYSLEVCESFISVNFVLVFILKGLQIMTFSPISVLELLEPLWKSFPKSTGSTTVLGVRALC